MNNINIVDVFTYSTPRQNNNTIMKTMYLFNQKIKQLTGKDCNNIKIDSIEMLEAFKKIVSSILYNIDSRYRFDVDIKYEDDSDTLKSEKIRCLREAILSLKKIHKKGLFHNNVKLEHFIINDKGNVMLINSTNKNQQNDENVNGQQNDIDVFEMYLSELIFDKSNLQYLKYEFKQILSELYK